MTLPDPWRSIGGIECAAVSDGAAQFRARAFFANAPQDALQSALAAHGLTGEHIHTPFHCLLARVGGATLLVEAGMGVPPDSGQLAANLRALGVDPAAIDIVLLSHAHADHLGGAVDAGGHPVLPNARYLLTQVEWDYWQEQSAGRVGALLEALRPQLDLIPIEGELLPGVSMIPVPGHTPGMIAVRFTSGGQTLVYTADTIAHPIHLQQPGWHIASDADPAQAIASRERLLRRAADEGWRLFVYHFPQPWIAGVAWQDGRWRAFSQQDTYPDEP